MLLGIIMTTIYFRKSPLFSPQIFLLLIGFWLVFVCYSPLHVAPKTVANPFPAVFFQFGPYFGVDLLHYRVFCC